MIDWESTGSSPPLTKNKDRVNVVCEKCGATRNILYQVAKRHDTHLCMSCVKTEGDFKTNQIVEYTCSVCGVKKEQKYRPDRYQTWKCHRCGMKLAHSENKFNTTGLRSPITQKTKDKISKKAKSLWADPEYVKKWKLARSLTKPKRSKTSKDIWADPNVRKKAAVSRAAQPKISSIQKILYEILKSQQINFIKESDDTIFGFYTFDCLLPGHNILIEVQGDYWHTLDKNINNDRSKFTYIDKYFPTYNIVYIWEHEFQDIFKLTNKLRAVAGLDQDLAEFEFKDVTIRKCEKKDVCGFLDSYHYIGGQRGGFVYGAYLHDELIACVMYSPPIRQNVAAKHGLRMHQVIELSRFCIHPLRHKKNLASWFISKTLKLLDSQFKLVVTYTDLSAGHVGTIYKSLNFKFSHIVPPNYWYIGDLGHIIGKKRVYDKALINGLKESEYAKAHNLKKQYGGKKLCFIYKLEASKSATCT